MDEHKFKLSENMLKFTKELEYLNYWALFETLEDTTTKAFKEEMA